MIFRKGSRRDQPNSSATRTIADTTSAALTTRAVDAKRSSGTRSVSRAILAACQAARIPIAVAVGPRGRGIERGGNFIDTADGYTNGKSEEMIGKFLKETNARDKIVLAKKYTFNQ